VLLHVFVTEIGGVWSSVPVKHSEVQYVMRELAHLETVLVFPPAADVGGAAHVGEADVWDGGPVADAGRQLDGLLYPVIPNPKGIPRGWTPAPVHVQACAVQPDSGNGRLAHTPGWTCVRAPAHRGEAASEQTGQRDGHSVPQHTSDMIPEIKIKGNTLK